MAGGEAGFHKERHTRQKSGLNNGKSAGQNGPHQPPTKPPACPECGSSKVWKDGIRHTRYGPIQRYICRLCGKRFSEGSSKGSNRFERVERVDSNALFSSSGLFFTRRVCVSEVGAKNLAAVETRKKRAAGATEPDIATIKGKIIEAAWRLKKEGYSKSTIYIYPRFLKLLVKYGANLYDPESVKEVIAEQESWGSNSKLMAICAYTFFTSINGIYWEPPKYTQNRKLPFIPIESEIDSLIASAGKKSATILQLLKESAMRIGEACKLKWIDVDLERNVITINDPEKGGNPRAFKISKKMASMLNALPRNSERLFGKTKPKDAAGYLRRLRKRVATKLQNPRLHYIHFHTLRHWKATIEYAKTKDILHVMKMLGHKNIQNTLIYTQLISFESDEYHSAVANTIDEAKALIETGFEYVCTHQNAMLFRKRK